MVGLPVPPPDRSEMERASDLRPDRSLRPSVAALKRVKGLAGGRVDARVLPEVSLRSFTIGTKGDPLE